MSGFIDVAHFRRVIPELKTSVFAWGIGSAVITESSQEESLVPRRAPAFDSVDAAQISVSRDRCLILTTTGELLCANLFDSTEPHITLSLPVAKKKVVKIASCSASDTFFALTSTGELFSWGTDQNLVGRDITDSFPATKPSPVKCTAAFADITVGSTHCLALTTEGMVYSWGIGKSGRLGHGACEDDELYPCHVQALKGYQVITIATGWGHSAILSADGRAFVWGKNDSGQLGLGPDTGNVDTPRVVRDLTSVRLLAVACGAFHTSFLTDLGQVYVAGDQLGTKASTPRHVPLNLWCVSITCGLFHTVAVCQGENPANPATRKMFVWGKNSSGELGLGPLGDKSAPVAMEALGQMVVVDVEFAMNCGFAVVLDPTIVSKHTEDVNKVIAAHATVLNTNALSRSKRIHSPSAFSHDSHTEKVANLGSDVLVWGSTDVFFPSDSLMDAGSGSLWSSLHPSYLKDLTGRKIISTASCDAGLLFLTADGSVHSTTFSPPSETQGNEPRPVPEKGDFLKPKLFQRQQIKHIACNNMVCFAVTQSGLLFSWHWRGVPLRPLLLGRESSEDNLYVPNIVPVSHIVNIVCGDFHVVALREDMQVMTWGMSRCGQLGHGDTETQRFPQPVKGLQPYRVVEVAAGTEHSVAITLDGRAWVWGKSADGQLGHGSEDSALVPTVLAEPTSVVACAAGSKHTVFLNNRGAVFVSGIGTPGKKTLVPVQIKLPFWALSVYAGPTHTVVVCENPDGAGQDQSTYTWGQGKYGVMGLADVESCNTPQLIRFLEGRQLISASFGCSQLAVAVAVKRNTS